MSFNEIFDEVKLILSEQFNIDKAKITEETNLFDDLEADSLDFADLLSTVEDKFGIEATDEVISSVSTVGDVVNYIFEATNNQK